MTSRLISEWSLDGFVSEQRYYCSESPIDPLNLPVPKAVLAGDVRTYIDSVGIEKGKQYYLAVGSVKNGIEKLSEQVVKIAGELWTPENLFNLPKLWLSSESIIKDSANRISQMTDQTVNALSFIQANNTYKPLYSDSAVKFDGINDRMTNSTRNLARNVTAISAFFVFDAIISPSQQCIFLIPSGTSNAVRFNVNITTLGSTTVGVRRLDSDAFASLTTASQIKNGANILHVEHDYSTATCKVRLNGIEYSSILQTTGATSNTNSFSDIALGFDPGNGRHFAGSLYDVLFSNSIDSGSDVEKLEGWAAHKYGLTGNLPIDHPYKVLVPTL